MIVDSDSRFRALEPKVGLFVLLALAGCLGALVFLGMQSGFFTPRYRLNFTVAKGTGFTRGMPVKLSGFRVGRVEEIALNDQARVDVRLSIEKKYQIWIRQDSVARLTKEGLVGDSIVEVAVGSPERPFLTDGATIPFEQSKGIEDQVSSLADQVKPVLADVGQIIAYVNDPQGEIKQTLRNVEALTRDLQTTRAKADRLIDASRTDLDTITRRVDGLLTQTESTLGTLNGTLQRLDHTVATIDAQLPGVLERVDRTLTHVEKVSADLQKVSSGVAPQLPRMISRTDQAIDATGDILQAVKAIWPVSSHLPAAGPPRLLEEDSHD